MESEKTELFNRYILPEKEFIYQLCVKYSKSKDECKELYSEVLINIFNGIETYNSQLHIRPWLYIVVKRFIGNLYLQQAKHSKIDFVDIENMPIPAIDTGYVSSDCIGIDNFHQCYSDDILQALNLVNPVARKAVLLQQAGYKMAEIAEKLYKAKLIKKPSIESVKYHLRVGKN